MTSYRAPWSRLLLGTTVIASLLVLGVAVLMWWQLGDRSDVVRILAATSLAVVPAAWLFSIRGYRLDGAHLYVRRPLWETEVDLRGLSSAEVNPGAMKGSIRLFGNGGLFAFSGLFRNAELGRYRAFLTDHARAVVLRTPERTVVVSPADPESFVGDILSAVPIGGAGAAERRREES